MIWIPARTQVVEDADLEPFHAFVGASSMERLPVEKGIPEMTAAFAAIKLTKK
jgi:predicted TIM-barrel enzyme